LDFKANNLPDFGPEVVDKSDRPRRFQFLEQVVEVCDDPLCLDRAGFRVKGTLEDKKWRRKERGPPHKKGDTEQK
jgi:hypothetical protein